jgi:multidrug resistance efflux pump
VLQGRAYCSLINPVVAPMTGQVREVLVQVGQAVKKDDVLVRLELLPGDAAAMFLRLNKGPAIRNHEIAVEQADLRLAQLDRAIEEARQLTAAGLAPRNALPDLMEQRALAARQQEAARLALADARRAASQDLQAMSRQLGQNVGSGASPDMLLVRAPQDGYVIGIEPQVVPGATVSGKLASVGVMDPMVIRGQVHESELGRLKSGETATIALDGGKGETVTATLTSVSWTALDSNLAAPSYYLFELSVPNPGLKIRDGNKVQITFPQK